MIFPIGDDNVQGGYKPIFSYLFLAFNVLAFVFQLTAPDQLLCSFAAIPNEISSGHKYYTLFTSMFLHGGVLHLVGNMLFLWIFADNIEACIGNIPFALFYIAGGLIASFAHIYFSYTGLTPDDFLNCCNICDKVAPCQNLSTAHPCPGSIPSVGASGAISAVMGAYLVMFPKSSIKLLVFFFGPFYVPAFLFLIIWFGQQLFSGLLSLGPESAGSGGVAWWAHIGGFVFGLVVGYLYKDKAKWKHPYTDDTGDRNYV